MSGFVLHIGTHKTGTTALQRTLGAARLPLRTHGIVYPRLHLREPGHHMLVGPWIDRYHDRRATIGLWRGLAKSHAGGKATLVLSSEEFSRARPQSVDFTELAGLVAGFGRRTVVCRQHVVGRSRHVLGGEAGRVVAERSERGEVGHGPLLAGASPCAGRADER